MMTPDQRRRMEAFRKAQAQAVGSGKYERHGNHLHKKFDPDRIIQHGGHTHTAGDAREHSGLIFGVLVVTMVLAQLGVYLWKKYYLASFNKATLLGLWLVPWVWAITSSFWRFVAVWLVFSVLTGRVLIAARQRQLAQNTPRMVYGWFYRVYRVCAFICTFGYVLVMMDFFAVSLLLPDWMTPLSPNGFMLMFYGLYFGVLGRDCAVMCCEQMASQMGYYRGKDAMPSKELPPNTCAVCDMQLLSSVRMEHASTAEEKIYTLNCGHQYHEFCIRGWTIIGKKDSCA